RISLAIAESVGFLSCRGVRMPSRRKSFTYRPSISSFKEEWIHLAHEEEGLSSSFERKPKELQPIQLSLGVSCTTALPNAAIPMIGWLAAALSLISIHIWRPGIL